MNSSKLRLSFASMQYLAGSVILFFIVALVPVVTIFKNSVQVNGVVAISQFLLFLVFFRQTIGVIKAVVFDRRNLVISWFIVGFVFVVFVSSFVNFTFSSSALYLSNVLMFFSAVYFFSISRKNFTSFLGWKVLSVLTVCVLFLVFRFLDKGAFYESVFRYPPVYRHLRHFNYDLMMALGAIFILLYYGKVRRLGFYILVSVFVLMSVWSGGRGELLALAVFLLLLSFCWGVRLPLTILLIVFFMSFVVLASDDATFMFEQVNKTLYSNSANGISTGRIDMWSNTWFEAVRGGWFGHGADQFRIYFDSWIVHPHNSLLQFVFEFGFFGLSLFVLFFLWTGLICLNLVFMSRSKSDLGVIAALILSMYVYSMVDGIFYHAIPFSFVVLLSAGLFVKLRGGKALATLS